MEVCELYASVCVGKRGESPTLAEYSNEAAADVVVGWDEPYDPRSNDPICLIAGC